MTAVVWWVSVQPAISLLNLVLDALRYRALHYFLLFCLFTLQAEAKVAPASSPASKTPLSDAGNSKPGSKTDGRPATRPSLALGSRAKSCSSKGQAAQKRPVNSTPEAVVDLSGSTKQHWWGGQRWTVPVKVKKQKKDGPPYQQG